MKKAIIFIVIAALVLTITPALIYAKNGPAEKVTGNIEIQRYDGKFAYAEFNAHEAIGNKSAKGEYHWWANNEDDSLFREIYINVTDVVVNGSNASFIGRCTYDSQDGANVGRWFLVKATDGGSPGVGNDTVGWDWFGNRDTDKPSFGDGIKSRTIIAGNLVVHAYE